MRRLWDTPNLESFHASPPPGWALPSRPVAGSHGPRDPAFRARRGRSGFFGGAGRPAGATAVLASPRGPGRSQAREELPRNSERAPTHRPARLTLRFRRRSPHSHPPRRRQPWGPWHAPRRAPFAGTGVTWGSLPPGRPAQSSPSWWGSLPASPGPGSRKLRRLRPRSPAPRPLLATPGPAPAATPAPPLAAQLLSVCARGYVCAPRVPVQGGVCVHARGCVRTCVSSRVCAPVRGVRSGVWRGVSLCLWCDVGGRVKYVFVGVERICSCARLCFAAVCGV